MTTTLVLGGTRSGKSAVAERLAAEAAGSAAVTYVATGAITDASMEARVAAHRARRPSTWHTVEAGADLPGVLAGLEGVVLLDSLGTWVAFADDMEVDATALCGVLADRPGTTVVVSEEVGLAVHPPTEVGRRFVDAIGSLNQAVARVSDRVLLVVAGRTLVL